MHTWSISSLWRRCLPYVVPLNYMYDGQAVWFHYATTGQKLDEIAANPNASFCVVEKDVIVPEEYTSYFRSVIVCGQIEIVTDDEASRGLELIRLKYAPDVVHEEQLARCGMRGHHVSPERSIYVRNASHRTRQMKNKMTLTW